MLSAHTNLKSALRIFEKQGSSHWRRFYGESLLGRSLVGQKRYAEAKPLLLAGYRGMLQQKDSMGAPNWFYLDEAAAAITQLYRAWGKPVPAKN
jgi:eukaryotic-like serine/threonine-protein kinase